MKRHFLFVASLCSTAFTIALAGDIGHYNGGVFDIRDYFMPPPGVYGLLYNYYYTSDRLNNGNGDKIGSLSLKTPVGPVSANVDVNINMYALMPVLLWSSPWQILGARYGGYIAPSFANNSLEADLSIGDRVGGRVHNSSFGVGDLYVQPVWLDWAESHWDVSLAYGFYAPSGRYNTQTVPLPGGSAVTVESADNIGLGFWEQQVQGAFAWYPMTNKATALTGALTYEYNGEKDGIDLRPGQILTLNWGASQYLPLTHDHNLLLEVGPAGYDSWQITDSTGSDAINPSSRSRVHGVGGQLGITYVPLGAFLTVHGFYEYAATSRFQGASIGVNLGIKL